MKHSQLIYSFQIFNSQLIIEQMIQNEYFYLWIYPNVMGFQWHLSSLVLMGLLLRPLLLDFITSEEKYPDLELILHFLGNFHLQITACLSNLVLEGISSMDINQNQAQFRMIIDFKYFYFLKFNLK